MPAALQQALGDGIFNKVMALQGEVFRDVPGRRTIRVRLNDRLYFAKLHYGVGWREIFKNLFSLRWPILSAMTEWRAIQRLGQIGISTTPAVACGCRGINPAHLQSFIITEDLGDITSLETLCAPWKNTPPDIRFKRRLIAAVADLARRFHDHGLNHRDFYLCHFCLDNQKLSKDELEIYLIDLHRVGIRRKIPTAARMKDIAALYFSAMDIGLTRNDYLRFLRRYRGDLRKTLKQDQAFWQQVQSRARKLYHKFHGRWPVTPFDVLG